MNIYSDIPSNKKIFGDWAKNLLEYEILVSKELRQNTKKEFLDDSTPNKCRFCEKSYPEVNFSFRSHTIPEFMGNKKLFSKFECDNCNKKYFNLFENELANFMLLHNTLSGTKGKKGIPKYKLKGKPLIKNEFDKIKISEVSKANFLVGDNYYFELKNIETPTYIPDYIHRCLVKIALSVVPEKQFANYIRTLKWLMNKDKNPEIKPFLLFSFYPYSLQMKNIIYTLFVKKEECEKNYPHTIFSLMYKSFAFQVNLPYSSKKLTSKLKPFPFVCPTPLDAEYKDHRKFIKIDLSSKKKKSGEKITLEITGKI